MLKLLLSVLKSSKILFNAKLEFSKPPHKRFLIFDEVNSEILKNYLKNNYTYLHCRNEKFNLYVLFFNFLNKKFNKLDYYNSYIGYVNPRIIISTIDNNPTFYKLKKNINQKKILIQMGWKSPIYDKSIFSFKKNKVKIIKDKLYNIDTILVFNKSIGNFFKSLNAKKVIEIGSFRSNHIEINSKKKIDLLYISSWNNIDPKKKYTNIVNGKEYLLMHNKILNNLNKYLEKYDVNLHILGKKNKFLNENLEFNFYKKIFKNSKWTFLQSEKYNSYKVVDSSKIIINLHSTLGYESLSRGNKTIFLDPYSNKIKTINFGWPCEDLKKNGPFWTTDVSFKGIEKIINNLKNMKNKKFLSLQKKYSKKLMPYNKKNTKLKSEIFTLNVR